MLVHYSTGIKDNKLQVTADYKGHTAVATVNPDGPQMVGYHVLVARNQALANLIVQLEEYYTREINLLKGNQ